MIEGKHICHMKLDTNEFWAFCWDLGLRDIEELGLDIKK
jgi:hypothetical protein